jgi:hydrocephalus-inducing protein
MSETLRVYEGFAAIMDIPGVGEGLLTLPIKAECVVPIIALEPSTLDFGQCFLRYCTSTS